MASKPDGDSLGHVREVQWIFENIKAGSQGQTTLCWYSDHSKSCLPEGFWQVVQVRLGIMEVVRESEIYKQDCRRKYTVIVEEIELGGWHSF